MSECVVLGGGAWGSALTYHLLKKGVLTTLVTRDDNPRFRDKLVLCNGLKLGRFDNLSAIEDKDIPLIIALPSSAYQDVLNLGFLKNFSVVISATKGLVGEDTPCTFLQNLGVQSSRLVALGGPMFASELSEGVIGSLVIAGSDKSSLEISQKLVLSEKVRVYLSYDLLGVELGAILKNIITLAIAIADGAELGTSARATIFTRGVVEMDRIIVALGGKSLTSFGLSGLGDLFMTATSDLSRNRQVGFALGRGSSVEESLRSASGTAEGLFSIGNLLKKLEKCNIQVDTPILNALNDFVNLQQPLANVIKSLITRPNRFEKI